ncbi:hypothetical protein [Sulfuricystis multivorans]|uniref:hypothetical protein n=1 Tax=Sulfuricystis multivorans TaxID=2211108 RepID=UPI000F83D5CF|nr:hypothetical protein [Sulfuricystis multivorans]
MLFNRSQLEGFAKIADNLATACAVASVIGGLVDHKIGVIEVIVLNAMAVGFASLAAFLRKGDGNGN